MSVERRLLKENPPARRVLYAGVGLAWLAAALWLALAWLLADVVNRVFLGGQNLAAVSGLLAGMLILMLLRAGLMWASDVVAQDAANRVKSDLRGRLTAHLFMLGPLYTRGERTGELVHTATAGIETLDEYFSQYQPARLLAGLVPVLVLVVILILDPWTLPILLFTGPILLILLALIGGRAKELTERRFIEMSWMSAHFMDMLQGLATLKMFGRSKEQARTIETISQHYGATTMEVLRTAFQTSLVLEWGATAATALVAITVSVRLMSGLMPFDRAFAVLLLTPEFFMPLRHLAMKYHAGTAGKVAAERIYAILDTPTRVKSPVPINILSFPTSPLPTQFDIRFEGVHVAYDNGARTALNDFSLKIAEGQSVALVGATGAGKTTVANLLLRFVEPTSGMITVGGVRLTDIDPAQWRTQVAWVAQHPYLFQGTVAENLRLAKPTATSDELTAAARDAHIHEFIQTLPRGYDTLIGEQGARLSGGQRQRLAIARAYLKDAPLLILDEATSHLDAATEALIQESLTRLMAARTTLIIAHRLTLAHDADTIVMLDGGHVIAQGTPRMMIEHSARYRQLVSAFNGGVA